MLRLFECIILLMLFLYGIKSNVFSLALLSKHNMLIQSYKGVILQQKSNVAAVIVLLPKVHFLIAPAAQQLPGHKARHGAGTPYSHSVVDYDRHGEQTLKIYDNIKYFHHISRGKKRLNCSLYIA